MIDLAPGEIHLWLAHYGDIQDERLLAAYRSILNDGERKQEGRFYFAKDRLRYLVTRALVRTVLSKYAALSPQDWVFSSNSYGRPEISNWLPTESHLTFNISHTDAVIVLGVARNRELGVDVENVLRREVSIDIANRFFAPVEVTDLADTPANRQQDRFFEYWTCKESYIKARGMGLSIPLDKFNFVFPQPRAIRFTTDSALADDATRWRFWQMRPAEQYILAICAERAVGVSTTFVVRTTVPMVGDEVIAPAIIRTTEEVNASAEK